MIPWIIVAVVLVPLVVVAYAATRRRTIAAEATARDGAHTEREVAAAEAFEAEWHEADKERFHQERLP